MMTLFWIAVKKSQQPAALFLFAWWIFWRPFVDLSHEVEKKKNKTQNRATAANYS